MMEQEARGYSEASGDICSARVSDPGAVDRRQRHVDRLPLLQPGGRRSRRVFQPKDKTRLDGLIYRSSRQPGSKAFVLFCENALCVDPGAENETAAAPGGGRASALPGTASRH
jgi:hypothetical protein